MRSPGKRPIPGEPSYWWQCKSCNAVFDDHQFSRHGHSEPFEWQLLDGPILKDDDLKSLLKIYQEA